MLFTENLEKITIFWDSSSLLEAPEVMDLRKISNVTHGCVELAESLLGQSLPSCHTISSQGQKSKTKTQLGCPKPSTPIWILMRFW